MVTHVQRAFEGLNIGYRRKNVGIRLLNYVQNWFIAYKSIKQKPLGLSFLLEKICKLIWIFTDSGP